VNDGRSPSSRIAQKPNRTDRKVAFLQRFGGFDKGILFGECVHTPVKRAYELSVCMSESSYRIPTYRAEGYVCSEAAAVAGQRYSDQRVQFSFHIVEIS
jgi:hypothetical protein